MKRRIFATLLTLLVVTSMFCLTACNKDTEHNWETTWTYGPDEHWHECTDEGCDYITDVADHTFVNDSCSVCGCPRM